MTPNLMRRIFMMFLLFCPLSGMAGCQESGKSIDLGIEIVQPEGGTLLTELSTLRMVITNADRTGETKSQTITLPQSGLTDGLSSESFAYWRNVVVSLEGRDASGSLAAFGATPLLYLPYFDDLFVSVYFARVGAASRPPYRLPEGRRGGILVSPNDFDTLVIGGRSGSEENPSDPATLPHFSPIFQRVNLLHEGSAPLTLPHGVTGHAATPLSATHVLVVGGYTENGAGDRTYLDLPRVVYVQSELDSTALPQATLFVPTMNASFAPRSGCGATTLFDESRAILCGGESPEGEILKDCAVVTTGDSPALSTGFNLLAARAGHQQIAARNAEGGVTGVFFLGGQAADAPGAEWLPAGTDETRAVSLPEDAWGQNARMCPLSDARGRLFVVAADLDSDPPTQIFWLFDPTCLTEGCDPATRFTLSGDAADFGPVRSEATLSFFGSKIALCGGRSASGEALADCLLLSPDAGSNPPTLTLDARIPLVGPRARHDAVVLPDGSTLLAGGVDAEGAPLSTFDILTPTPVP